MTDVPTMPGHAMISRRMLMGSAGIAGLATAGLFGYAALSGRLPILTPVLPDGVDLKPIEGVRFRGEPVAGVSSKGFAGQLVLINVWASWCPNCRAEHGELMQLSEVPGLRLTGIVSDDTAENVRTYLTSSGNPYAALALDEGRVFQRAFKQRGVPATLIFRPDGGFVHRILGEITPARRAAELMPALARARAV